MSQANSNHRMSRRSLMQAAAAGALLSTVPVSSTGTVAAVRQEGDQGADDAVFVYPAAGTRTASPQTEVSFRGVTKEALGEVIAVGSLSGGHSGVYAPHSDGRGVSFLPDVPFLAGESVHVTADTRLNGEVDGAVTFTIAVPGEVPVAKEGQEVDAPDTPPHAFRSRPDVRPPVIDIVRPASEETAPGYIFIGAKIPGGQDGALIVDDQGDVIWFGPPTNTALQHNDVRVQTYQGEPVLTLWEGISETGYGLGHYVIMDRSYQRIATVQAGNGYPGADLHEFLLTSRGTAFIVVYNPVMWDLTPAGGGERGTVVDGIVQEIDIQTGRVLFEWHSLDHIAVEESYIAPPETDAERHDYLHINSVDEDVDGNLVISARNTYAVYKIVRESGEIGWRLNGRASDFEQAEGAGFIVQHDARVLPDGMLSVLDNVAPAGGEESLSRGLVIDLDEEEQTAELLREYIHPEELLAETQANMQVLPNGNVFIGWGSAPAFTEFSAEGDVLLDGRLPEGGSSYRAYRFPWMGLAADQPAMAVEPGAGGGLQVFASWNGATEVATWRVLTGASEEELAPVADSERSGFETTIAVEEPASVVAVEALGSDGDILGRSEVQTVGG